MFKIGRTGQGNIEKRMQQLKPDKVLAVSPSLALVISKKRNVSTKSMKPIGFLKVNGLSSRNLRL